MAERIERKKQHTPILFVKYATLGEPYFDKKNNDTKGSYSITFRMTEEQFLDFMEKHEPIHAELEALQLQVLPKGKKVKRHPDKFVPIEPEIDKETGDETGSYILKIRKSAFYESKKEKGVMVPLSPPLVVDAGNNKLSKQVQESIGYGSTARAGFTIGAYVTPEGYLRMVYGLDAVQIVKLVERDANTSPFSVVVDDDAFMSNDSAASVSSADNEDL